MVDSVPLICQPVWVAKGFTLSFALQHVMSFLRCMASRYDPPTLQKY